MYFKLYSSNIFSLIYEGASVSGSSPDCVLGNGITSLIEFWLYTSAINLSMHIANPACCGVPYESASINQPNLSWISSLLKPHFSRTIRCKSGLLILWEPDPSSTPLRTKS